MYPQYLQTEHLCRMNKKMNQNELHLRMLREETIINSRNDIGNAGRLRLMNIWML